MKIHRIVLRRAALPLVHPFRTSQYTEYHKNLLALEVQTDAGTGFAECSADDLPVYWGEYSDGAADIIRRIFGPDLIAEDDITPARVAPVLAHYKGNRTAKAALEAAVLDAWCRSKRVSLADYFGATRTRVEVGVSIGITETLDELLDQAAGYVADGYRRLKLKIEPGWDIEVVEAVRRAVGPAIDLQVDGNGAYSLADARLLARLDAFDLTLVEQPLAFDDLRAHAELARRLATPICLDESIVSVQSAAAAISLGACRIINIKPSRVGGYLESRRIHDLCLGFDVPVWCGGMLESGIGRAANLALAALPGFTLPGDISATDRYFTHDVTAPFRLEDGHIAVPSGPGIGVEVDVEYLDSLTIWRAVVE